jgi:hypothetical protein
LLPSALCCGLTKKGSINIKVIVDFVSSNGEKAILFCPHYSYMLVVNNSAFMVKEIRYKKLARINSPQTFKSTEYKDVLQSIFSIYNKGSPPPAAHFATLILKA